MHFDNVLEHIENPKQTMDECLMVTQPGGGSVIAVPGVRGFARDSDHKILYPESELEHLDPRWEMTRLFSIPFFIRSRTISKAVRQYCLAAVYRKRKSNI